MKLYLSPGACSMAVHILLEELGHPYETAVVSVARGDTARPDFLVLNPKGRVPVLELDDGSVITELIAIIAYLQLRFPGRGIVPEAPLEAARAWEWLSWLGSDVHARSFGAIWRPGRFTPDVEAHAAVSAAGRASAMEQFGRIEGMLGRAGSWALGEERSCVDAALLVYYQWGLWVGFDMVGRCPAWTAHARRMLQLPAVCRVLEREGLGPALARAVDAARTPSRGALTGGRHQVSASR